MQRTFRMAALLAAGALSAGNALAQVDIDGAWVRGTVPAQTSSGAFMTLHAHEAAKLVGVSSPVAKSVELHEMKMENNVMRMRGVSTLDLPKMQDVEMKPGGYHIMLVGLTRQLKAGETVPLTLKFQMQDKKIVETKINAEVRALNGGAAAGHSAHPAGHDHKHKH